MTDWIAGHWDSTGLRLWGMSEAAVLWRAGADLPATGQTAATYQAALAEALEGQDGGAPVLLAGPVAAPGGWYEAPTAALPCLPLAAGVHPVPGSTTVFLLGGLTQASPPDRLHGAEAPLAGFLDLNPGFDGVVCLPGPITVWGEVSAGEVISTRSFLSGDVVRGLRTGVLAPALAQAEDWDAEAFGAALSSTLSRPERLASGLAELRVSGAPYSSLHGLLIGAELAATRAYWLGRPLAVIAGRAAARPYLAALSAQGVPALHADWEPMFLRGMVAAWRMKG